MVRSPCWRGPGASLSVYLPVSGEPPAAEPAPPGGVARILCGFETGDPVALSAVAASVVFVGLLAAWVPAHRASRVDPIEAIRQP